ncbi:tRNA methyltransferase 10 homolog A [Aplysia californica]|uniref:tRNA (guanine(9)-N(1))-methyltransferase n=1 Tax=Aplysia californica TaxID=6500 RepID=A0ABM0JD87_APLCA|nr:tRNA methyltransferase 10 homolog A [Aplysia californica]
MLNHFYYWSAEVFVFLFPSLLKQLSTAVTIGNMDHCDINKSEDKGVVDDTQKLSKNQLKKLKRKERWLAVKQERRQQEKQKRKQRLAERREKGEDIGPNRKRLKTNTMKNSSCKIQVVLDLSLDEYMNDKDVTSLTCQLRHCYSANRRAQNPLQMHFCGSSGKTMKRLDEIGDYKGWDVYVDTRPYDEAFSKDSLVYLTSESPNILSDLSEDKVYVIGGLVDHNKHKGLCHQLAEDKGIAHAQLPIGDYFEMTTRKVLAVNHVFSMLLRFTELHDWKKAFLSEMPQRKQASLKEKNADTAEEEKEGELEEEDEDGQEEEFEQGEESDNEKRKDTTSGTTPPESCVESEKSLEGKNRVTGNNGEESGSSGCCSGASDERSCGQMQESGTSVVVEKEKDLRGHNTDKDDQVSDAQSTTGAEMQS